ATATAEVGTPYTFTYQASGSPAPKFQVTAGALPPGLALDPDTGAISGTPTTAGPFGGTVTASSSAGSAAQDFSITVGQAPTTVTLGSIADVTYGNPVAPTAAVLGPDGQAVSGLTATITYYAGSSATGTPLAGAPTAAGTYTAVASFAGSHDYTANTNPDPQATFNITPAALTITADAKTMVQGSTVPALTAQYSGFVNGDTSASLT